MAETVNPQSPTLDSGRWIGRVLLAVILGEGIWGLLVSLTHDLIVPALARVMGGDPQSPLYLGDGNIHIPGIFTAVLQFCLAGIVAIILNSWVNRGQRTVRVVTRRVIPAPAPVPAPGKATVPVAPPQAVAPSPAVFTPVVTAPPLPTRTQPPSAPVAQPAPVAKAPTPAAPPPPQKPAKPRPVYYNSVGDPIPFDDE